MQGGLHVPLVGICSVLKNSIHNTWDDALHSVSTPTKLQHEPCCERGNAGAATYPHGLVVDARPGHRVGFTSTGLPVGKQAPIVPCKHIWTTSDGRVGERWCWGCHNRDATRHLPSKISLAE